MARMGSGLARGVSSIHEPQQLPRCWLWGGGASTVGGATRGLDSGVGWADLREALGVSGPSLLFLEPHLWEPVMASAAGRPGPAQRPTPAVVELWRV